MKVFGFIKNAFFAGLTILSSVNLFGAAPLKCFSKTNQKCNVRPEIANVNGDKSVFYHFSIKTSKWSGSCNNINDPCGKMCVPDVVKNLNVKVFSLLTRTNETRLLKRHGTCK